MFSDTFYKLKANFECPSFHTCNVFSTFERCAEHINQAVSAVGKRCIEVSGELIGYKVVDAKCWVGPNRCPYEQETGEVLFPNTYVSVMQTGNDSFMEKNETLVTAARLAVVVGICAFIYYKCKSMNRQRQQ